MSLGCVSEGKSPKKPEIASNIPVARPAGSPVRRKTKWPSLEPKPAGTSTTSKRVIGHIHNSARNTILFVSAGRPGYRKQFPLTPEVVPARVPATDASAINISGNNKVGAKVTIARPAKPQCSINQCPPASEIILVRAPTTNTSAINNLGDNKVGVKVMVARPANP